MISDSKQIYFETLPSICFVCLLSSVNRIRNPADISWLFKNVCASVSTEWQYPLIQNVLWPRVSLFTAKFPQKNAIYISKHH